jgi:hypothetical protein
MFKVSDELANKLFSKWIAGHESHDSQNRVCRIHPLPQCSHCRLVFPAPSDQEGDRLLTLASDLFREQRVEPRTRIERIIQLFPLVKHLFERRRFSFAWSFLAIKGSNNGGQHKIRRRLGVGRHE